MPPLLLRSGVSVQPRHLRETALTAVVYPLVASATPAAGDPTADLQAQASSLAAQIQAQNEQQDRLTEEYNLPRLRADSVTAEVEAAKAQVAQNQARLRTISDRLRQDAVNSFMDGGTDQSIDVLKDARYDSLLRQQYVDARRLGGPAVQHTPERSKSAGR